MVTVSLFKDRSSSLNFYRRERLSTRNHTFQSVNRNTPIRMACCRSPEYFPYCFGHDQGRSYTGNLEIQLQGSILELSLIQCKRLLSLSRLLNGTISLTNILSTFPFTGVSTLLKNPRKNDLRLNLCICSQGLTPLRSVFQQRWQLLRSLSSFTSSPDLGCSFVNMLKQYLLQKFKTRTFLAYRPHTLLGEKSSVRCR